MNLSTIEIFQLFCSKCLALFISNCIRTIVHVFCHCMYYQCYEGLVPMSHTLTFYHFKDLITRTSTYQAYCCCSGRHYTFESLSSNLGPSWLVHLPMGLNKNLIKRNSGKQTVIQLGFQITRILPQNIYNCCKQF